MNTNAAGNGSDAGAKLSKSVFMGSGLAAARRPGMTHLE
jgi:hypothetical protein